MYIVNPHHSLLKSIFNNANKNGLYLFPPCGMCRSPAVYANSSHSQQEQTLVCKIHISFNKQTGLHTLELLHTQSNPYVSRLGPRHFGWFEDRPS